MAVAYPWSYGAVLVISHSSIDLEGDAMKDMFKSQAFRVVMILSALASSSLVLMAGRRWS